MLSISDLPPMRAVFDALALVLAVLADGLLDVLSLPVDRSLTELRSTDGTWAVVVTDVCDGHGLVAAWLAVTAALTHNWRAALRMAAIGLVVIEVFNFARVMALAVTLASAPSAFEAVHLFIFPLLTVAVFAATLVVAPGLPRRRMGMAILVGSGLAVAWGFVAAAVSGALLVPPANLLLALLDPVGIDTLRQGDSGWVVATWRLAAIDPPAFLIAPIYPQDFAIALPALIGAAIAVRGGYGGVVLALVFMGVALVLGTMTAGWSAPEMDGLGQMVSVGADGSVTVGAYNAPTETLQALVRLAQNGLVHFNLLVLPLLILSRGEG